MYDEFDRKFTDDLCEDKYTFLNVNEFSEYAEVDGVLMRCQIEHYTGKKATVGRYLGEKSKRIGSAAEGLHGDFTTIYFDAETYIKKRERLPRNGEWVHINGKRYDVVSAENEMGVAKIECSAYRQNVLREQLHGRENPYV